MMQRDLFDQTPDQPGERQVDIETIIEEKKMFGYNPCDFDPALAERRNLEGAQAAEWAWARAEDQLRDMGLDPEDFEDPIAAIEDLENEADMQADEDQRNT